MKEMTTNIQVKPGRTRMRPLAVGAFLAGLCLSGIGAQAAIISDDFSQTGGLRTSGATLDGTTTMTGSATWAATGCNFAGTAPDVYASVGFWSGASVSLASITTDTVVRCQATMKDNIYEGSGQIQLNVGNVGSSYPTKGISVMLQNPGNCLVWINGSHEMSYSPASYNYVAGGLNLYSIEYNSVTKLLNVWANNVWLMQNKDATSFGISSSDFTMAGFNAAYAGQVGDFSVSMVPEPAALALLALGGLALIRRGRRD